MKDNKNVRIEIRMTPKEKEYLKQFAEAHNLTVSEAVRIALSNLMNKEEK